jgi:hypothetical protein
MASVRKERKENPMTLKNPYKTKFFYKTKEVNVWHPYHKMWTGRIPVERAASNPMLMAAIPADERDRIRRMAATAR